MSAPSFHSQLTGKGFQTFKVSSVLNNLSQFNGRYIFDDVDDESCWNSGPVHFPISEMNYDRKTCKNIPGGAAIYINRFWTNSKAI